MILYPRGSRPATTCSALFRILVGVALTAELANSLASEEEPDGRDTGPSGSAGKGEELANNAGLHLRSRDFDLTYTVPKTAIDDDEGIAGARRPIFDNELIARAMRDNIFLTPEEWDARENRRRGDNTYGNRNGRLLTMPEIRVKPECQTSTICDEVIYDDGISYPTSFVENLNNLETFRSAFAGPASSHGPANRMGDHVDDDKLCSTVKVYQQFPLAVRKNLSDTWHLVINVPSFQQEFNVVSCENPGGKCEHSFGDLEGGLDLGHSICRQQFVERTVVVMNGNGTSAVVDSFPMPGGCCCNLINAPEARFGGNSNHRLRQSHDTRGRPHRHPREY